MSKKKSREVESSCFRHLSYDSRSQVLEVEFRNGGLYHYFGVPSRSVGRLLAAPSMGRFFGRRIRGNYDYVGWNPVRSPI